MFSIIKKEPHLTVCMRQKNFLQGDDVGMSEFPQQLKRKFLIVFSDFLRNEFLNFFMHPILPLS